MDVILHTDFKCAPEGHTTFSFRAGDTLTGRAAELAMKAGVAFNPVEETKPAFAFEIKTDPIGFGENFARQMVHEINKPKPTPPTKPRRKGKNK